MFGAQQAQIIEKNATLPCRRTERQKEGLFSHFTREWFTKRNENRARSLVKKKFVRRWGRKACWALWGEVVFVECKGLRISKQANTDKVVKRCLINKIWSLPPRANSSKTRKGCSPKFLFFFFFFPTLTVRFGCKTLDQVTNSRYVFVPNISYEPMRNYATLSNSFLFSGLKPTKSLASKKKRNIVTSYWKPATLSRNIKHSFR